jgi:DUF1009 family protein
MALSLALIAGAGRFPFHVAQEAKRQGATVFAIGLRGWADPSLAQQVDSYQEVSVGELGALIAHLKQAGIRQAVMAGKVTKEILFDQRTAFDAEAAAVLSHVTDYSVPALLGAIGQRLGQEGITLLDSSTFLQSSLCPAGVLTVRGPTPVEAEDIRVGFEVARALAMVDVGQTIIVKQRVIVAVEALEGTDAAIQRAHCLAGAGLVVVKTASPTQDRRFDLPVVGLLTLETLKACGVSCLAVEAGSTILLDREALLAAFSAAQIAMVGVTPPAA